MPSVRDWTLVVALNDDAVLRNTLLRSPDVNAKCRVLAKSGFRSAGAAYNSGLAEAKSEVVVFAHQDLYFPPGWKDELDRSLRRLATEDPNWGVLGVFGITNRIDTRPSGHCYSTGLRRCLGAPFDDPLTAHTLDELVLIVRNNSGLQFDENLPGFHLYGADICLQARALGMKSYIVPAFCIHNSNGIKYLSTAYWGSYFYLRRKWWQQLPITTCCSRVSRSLRPVVAQVISDSLNCISGGRRVGTRCDDVVRLYRSMVNDSHGVAGGLIDRARPCLR